MAEDGPSGSSREYVVVVHGTFDRDGTWWRPGESFCRQLDAALASRGLPTKCWPLASPDLGDPVVVAPFSWDGLNSEASRSAAAAELAAYIRALSDAGESGPPSRVFLVGHSHGGNVILDALRALHPVPIEQAADPPIPESPAVSDVFLLGTPVYQWAEKRTPAWLQVAVSLMFAAALISLAIMRDGITIGAYHVPWPLMIYTYACFFVTYLFLTYRGRAQYQQPDKTTVHVLASRNDEALHLLRSALASSRHARHMARSLVNIRFDSMLARRFQPITRFVAITQWLARLAVDPPTSRLKRGASWLLGVLSGLGLLVLMALGVPFVVLLVLDQTLFRLISAVLGFGRRFALQLGIRAISRTALGLDVAGSRLATVTTAPTDFQVDQRPLDDETEALMLRRATGSAELLLRTFYGAAATSSEKGDGLSLDQLAEVYQSPRYVHCQYYSQPEIIERIADGIANARRDMQLGDRREAFQAARASRMAAAKDRGRLRTVYTGLGLVVAIALLAAVGSFTVHKLDAQKAVLPDAPQLELDQTAVRRRAAAENFCTSLNADLTKQATCLVMLDTIVVFSSAELDQSEALCTAAVEAMRSTAKATVPWTLVVRQVHLPSQAEYTCELP